MQFTDVGSYVLLLCAVYTKCRSTMTFTVVTVSLRQRHVGRSSVPPSQASVWKPTCRHGKEYQAPIPARRGPRPEGACDDPRAGVRGPDEAAAKLLARTVEKAAADALPPDAVQVRRSGTA